MSRLRRFASGVISGYAALFANIAFTMASVPLALHYLSKTEFGLWALITQITGYFALIDVGMSGAVARILVDHKDDRNGGSYGTVFKTGALVFSIQGLLIALLGSAASWVLPSLMRIPSDLNPVFKILMASQCLLLGLTFCTKILGSVLWCHQRSDIVNLASAVVFGVNFAALWLGFRFGLGLYSMLLASALSMFCNSLAAWIASSHLQLFPERGCWGSLSWQAFQEVYDYARNLFLITIGTQLLTASQVVIVTRTLGLDAAAVWAVATKIFTLAQQVVFRICDLSVAALVEMFVRHETSLLERRFRQLMLFSASLSIVVGGTVAFANGSFLAIWTRGRIAWGFENDLLMALLLVLYAVVRCHTALMDVTKELRGLKYVSLAEGLCFVPSAILLSQRFGFAGVIGAAAILNIMLLGTYGVGRTVKYFKIRTRTVVFVWLGPAVQMMSIFLPLAVLIWWSTTSLPPWARLTLCGGVTGTIGLVLLVFVGVTRDMRDELFTRLRLFTNRNTSPLGGV